MTPLLLETIKCLDGLSYHLDYHQRRLDYSRHCLGYTDPLVLTLTPPEQGLYRCRILYSDTIKTIEYLPYTPKEFKNFKLLHSQISYDLKYEDRSELNALLEHKQEADEIIIVKDGLITDTSISNLCFFDGKRWLTPKTPLLKGTTRQRLLDEGKVIEADIPYTQLHRFEKIGLLNAMLGFQIIENAIIS